MSYLDLVRRTVVQRPASVPEALTSKATTSNIEAILSLPLDRFASVGEIVEIRVSYLDVTLFLVSSEREVSILSREGITRGRIWTAGELSDVLSIGITTAGIVTIATAKAVFDGDLSQCEKSEVSEESSTTKSGSEISERSERRGTTHGVDDVPF